MTLRAGTVPATTARAGQLGRLSASHARTSSVVVSRRASAAPTLSSQPLIGSDSHACPQWVQAEYTPLVGRGWCRRRVSRCPAISRSRSGATCAVCAGAATAAPPWFSRCESWSRRCLCPASSRSQPLLSAPQLLPLSWPSSCRNSPAPRWRRRSGSSRSGGRLQQGGAARSRRWPGSCGCRGSEGLRPCP